MSTLTIRNAIFVFPSLILVCISFTFAQMARAAVAEEPMIEVPQGSFTMGSNKIDVKEQWKKYNSREPWYLNEHPKHSVFLDTYFIDKFEVTNKAYAQFVQRTRHSIPKYWLNNGYAFQFRLNKLNSMDAANLRHIITNIMQLDLDTRKLNIKQLLEIIKKRWAYQDTLPITHATWFDANKYCQFRGKRLPSEQEWEKAARGTRANEFVFGNNWQAGWSNVGEEYWEDGVAPIGSYPKDKSSYGVMDMAGNVYEWVSDWYRAYPNSDYQHEDFGTQYRTVRGSSYGKDGHYFLIYYQRTAYRTRLNPKIIVPRQGFRCAKDSAKE